MDLNVCFWQLDSNTCGGIKLIRKRYFFSKKQSFDLNPQTQSEIAYHHYTLGTPNIT